PPPLPAGRAAAGSAAPWRPAASPVVTAAVTAAARAVARFEAMAAARVAVSAEANAAAGGPARRLEDEAEAKARPPSVIGSRPGIELVVRQLHDDVRNRLPVGAEGPARSSVGRVALDPGRPAALRVEGLVPGEQHHGLPGRLAQQGQQVRPGLAVPAGLSRPHGFRAGEPERVVQARD